MTWYCPYCLATLTYTGRSAYTSLSIVQECPRCGKRMDRDDATGGEAA